MTDNSKKRGTGGRLQAGASHCGTRPARAATLTVVAAAALAAVLAGCSTPASTVSQPPTSKLVRVPGNSEPSIVLTQLGAERIGLKTAVVTTAPGGEATFPYTALLYEPNGQAAVYVATGTLTFTRAFVTVDTISGNVVVVKSGVTPGRHVATDGAEELLGVQNGVGEET
jgi:multidrug efflux pump subunit AcrA (membrane-fusion protein)